MPTVTYKGPHKAGRNMGRMGHWFWGKEEQRSQEWVDTHARGLVGEFVVDGVKFALPAPKPVKVDEGNDGIPDMKWTKGDIMSWLDEQGVSYSVLSTKTKLIAKATEHLSPTEDSMSEGGMEQPNGDEE